MTFLTTAPLMWLLLGALALGADLVLFPGSFARAVPREGLGWVLLAVFAILVGGPISCGVMLALMRQGEDDDENARSWPDDEGPVQ